MDHQFFLWGSYAFTAAVIAVEIIGLYLRRKNSRFSALSREIQGENT
jgi:heme exporter protein CcmD